MDRPTVLQKVDWQALLFSSAPKRSRLLSLEPSWPCRTVRIRVHRNHGFELVQSVLLPYLGYADLAADWAISDYDDSLSFELEGEADLELVWLDATRYHADVDLGSWLSQRLEHLRERSGAPVLLVAVGGRLEELQLPPGVFLGSVSEVEASLGEAFYDERRSAHTGTRLSNRACIALARELGCRWLPAALRPALKAVIFDLDHTLYRGVLGEDGIDGVLLTDGHRALQQRAVDLLEAGLFVGLCSRNEAADVEALFAAREDFPLRWEHFVSTRVSWGDKAQALVEIADELRIGVDAMLFVDDNPGELVSVHAQLPTLQLLHARPDGHETAAALSHTPGLFRWRSSAADAVRVKDLKASRERDRLGETLTDQAYFETLGIRIRMVLDEAGQLPRIASLSGKTNQFNLAFSRLDEAAVARILDAEDQAVVSVHLADRLSDSGLIGVVVGRREADGALAIDELCVSCRALGRRLEDILVFEAVAMLRAALGATGPTRFMWREGPRNQPALRWLSEAAGLTLAGESGEVELPTDPSPDSSGVVMERYPGADATT